MRRKSLFLSLLILAPLAVIGFLYLFGKNQYTVKGSRLSGRPMPALLGIVRPNGAAMLVGLLGTSVEETTLRTRVESRVRRIGKEGGRLAFCYLADYEAKPALPYSYHKTSLARQSAILTRDLGLPPDTGGLGSWYLLVDSGGRLLNAYDLRQERLLDTLAIEATIASGAR